MGQEGIPCFEYSNHHLKLHRVSDFAFLGHPVRLKKPVISFKNGFT